MLMFVDLDCLGYTMPHHEGREHHTFLRMCQRTGALPEIKPDDAESLRVHERALQDLRVIREETLGLVLIKLFKQLERSDDSQHLQPPAELVELCRLTTKSYPVSRSPYCD